eukprot:gnl/MRDRNA2_/MRDRNA2_106058_c0_seq1.p1 gnl/MRDRNA2_/MRDRNA2_106058_c0~~gnl/MRDRNA2_/MRDRNA2_106058_c0_seq1.p1  ORF type:complete len:187 (+),score=38.82 gnl/MRDRNA2_/MRDRNA2_106058_c0_seq1:106-666(+)
MSSHSIVGEGVREIRPTKATRPTIAVDLVGARDHEGSVDMVEALTSLDEHLDSMIDSQQRVEQRLGDILKLKNSGHLRGLCPGLGSPDWTQLGDNDNEAWEQRLKDTLKALDTQQRRLGEARNAAKVAERPLEVLLQRSTASDMQVENPFKEASDAASSSSPQHWWQKGPSKLRSVSPKDSIRSHR